MLEPLHQDAQRLIQRHPRRKEMGELLRKKIEMRVGERLNRPGGNRSALRPRFRRRHRTAGGSVDRFDLNGNPTLRLHLHDRARAIIACENSVDQLPIRLTRDITKLRHGTDIRAYKAQRQAFRLAFVKRKSKSTIYSGDGQKKRRIPQEPAMKMRARERECSS